MAAEINEPNRLSKREQDLLRTLYGKIWVEVYYDPENESIKEFCTPLVAMFKELNETLKFKT